MAYKDESGIVYNSFYETDKKLGMEPRTEEELIEYKRLIGMPISEDYDELIASLKDNQNKNNGRRLKVSRVEFNDYDFIRLFLAYLKLNGSVFIDKDNLRYELYELYQNPEYKDLFQDFAVKQQIEGNFLDIEEALQNAVLYGLLSSHDCNHNNSRRIIFIDENESISIEDSYNEIYREKMERLVGEFLDKSIKRSEKYHYDGKIKQLKKRKIQINDNK